jgi:hypothetical protein
MNTQKVFNLSLALIAISTLVQQVMYLAGLVKDQYVGGANLLGVYLGSIIVSMIGTGIYLIMNITSWNFILDKFEKLVGYNNEQETTGVDK